MKKNIYDLNLNGKKYQFFSLPSLDEEGFSRIDRLPFSIKVLLENILRQEDGRNVTQEHIKALADWDPKQTKAQEIPYMPARVILQDFTGVPCVVDLATMRDVVKKWGGDPSVINPLQPVDLVIDHSVQTDSFGLPDSFKRNVEKEYERNAERYSFLKWGQGTFQNFRVVPPGTGIIHQVNLEYLGSVIFEKKENETTWVYPDTLIGTDSHTTMINALGILGWGVGGIEAEAAMLGQPVSMLIPQVIGVKLSGSLKPGVNATDLVLTLTEALRKKGVVGKFVEFFGPGVEALSLPDRATLSNMCPEYGATVGFFPVDQETLAYLKNTGRSDDHIALVEAYAKIQGLFRSSTSEDPIFTDVVELNLSDVTSSLAGPKRPQDRINLHDAKKSFSVVAPQLVKNPKKTVAPDRGKLSDGSVVIASITSCTNTSNPSVLIEAGLLAQKAVERGLQKQSWVKTSLAPGSRVVMDYLTEAGLKKPLEDLGFHLVGYGCLTCIGNSGPLPTEVEQAIQEKELLVSSVLSGNRNFEGRIHALVRANYLMSPALVVAYALAGNMDVDLVREVIGKDTKGQDVFLKDIWPTQDEVKSAVNKFVKTSFFKDQYAAASDGDEKWQAIQSSQENLFQWNNDSTYIQPASFLLEADKEAPSVQGISGARVLALLGDSVTTDHISPAGSIAEDSPAGTFLKNRDVGKLDFNSYGSRRGNDAVMMRGTFANVRLRNKLNPDVEGGFTKKMPEGKVERIYDAAVQYAKENVPLVILAGKEYGSGSSRDWAAKGTKMLGVKAVIAESYERIHRSNLVMMGILPLQFQSGESSASLGLKGDEIFDLQGLDEEMQTGQRMKVVAVSPDAKKKVFDVMLRIDTPKEMDYYRHGGVLPYVVRQLVKKK